jgi:hypothetical protein
MFRIERVFAIEGSARDDGRHEIMSASVAAG